MTKYLLPALLVLSLFACSALTGGTNAVGDAANDVLARVEALEAAKADPATTLERLDELQKGLATALTGFAEAIKALPQAAKDDAGSISGALPHGSEEWLSRIIDIVAAITGVNVLRNRNLFTKGARVAGASAVPQPPIG